MTIYHADAVEVAAFTNGTVVTDPPYNIGYKYATKSDRREASKYDALLRDSLRTPSVVLAYPEVVFRAASVIGLVPSRCAAWVYPANTPRNFRLAAWFGTMGYPERVTQPYKNERDKRIRKLIENGREARGYDWREIPQVKNVSLDKTGHPCQNPIEVMDWLIRSTDVEKVIDPFMGSGTTLVAAKILGIPAIGCDSDESYCEIAAKRCAKTRLPLFE